MEGKKFGKLLVLEFTRTNIKEKTRYGKREGQKQISYHKYYLCQCDCGNTKEIWDYNLTKKVKPTLSCGCNQIESVTTHGMKGTDFYMKWNSMHSRCKYPSAQSYPRYGGRGIKVCEMWNKFENFKEDMYKSFINHKNKYGIEDTQLDRIDSNGNYEPINCRWATRSMNAKNRRIRKRNENGTWV